MDIIKLNVFGSRASGSYPKDLERYSVYGETLYSPCSGKVTKAVDGLPDLIPPKAIEKPAGNHIIIDYEESGIYIIITEGKYLKRNGITRVRSRNKGLIGRSPCIVTGHYVAPLH